MQSLADIRAGTIDQFLAWWLANAVLPAAEQKTFDHYYRSYRRRFGPYVRRYYARQSRELVELIRARTAPRVLEVGCGCGTESLWASIQGGDVTGIDIDPDLQAVAKARRAFIEHETGETLASEFRRTSVLDADETKPFDIIFLEQSFHHLEPRADGVAKLARLVVRAATSSSPRRTGGTRCSRHFSSSCAAPRPSSITWATPGGTSASPCRPR